MNYLITFLYYLTWIISILGYGYLIFYIFRLFKIKIEVSFSQFLTSLGFIGFVFIYLISSILNFFIPISFIISTIIQILGIIVFFLNIKYFLTLLKSINIASLIFLFIFCFFIPFRWLQYYDTGLYHFQLMKWIVYSKVPFGISNLYYAFGTNTAWFSVSAVTEQPALLFKYPNFITNAILLFFYGLGISYSLKEIINKKITLSNIFLILTSIPWIFNSISSWSSSTSYDMPVGFFTFFLTYLFIYYFENIQVNFNKDFVIFLIFTFSIFTFIVKISSIPIVLIFFIILFLTLKNKEIKIAILSVSFSALLFLPWVIKGVINSGYIIFPAVFTKLSFLKWSTPSNIAKESIANIRHMARGPNLSREITLSSFGWISDWINRFYISYKIIILMILACLFLFIIMLFKKNSRKIVSSSLFLPLFASFIGIIFWFFNIPDVRYGQGFIFSFIIILMSYAIYKIDFSKKSTKNLFNLKRNENKNIIKFTFLFLGIFIVLISLLFLFYKDFQSLLLNLLSLIRNKGISDLGLIKLKTLVYIFCSIGLITILLGIYYFKNKKSILLSSIIISMSFSLIITQGFLFYQKEYRTYPTSTKFPEVVLTKNITSDGSIVFVLEKGDQLWDSILPATPFFRDDLKIIYAENLPKMFYFENNK